MSDALAIYVIYDHPKDFPDEYVCRRQYVTGDGQILADRSALAHDVDLAKVRAALPPGLCRFPRDSNDDECILESWM